MIEDTIQLPDFISATFCNDPVTGEHYSIKLKLSDTGNMFIPVSDTSRHYAEILRRVEAGTLTIQEAS